jgi:hypothetical protein
MTILKSLFTVLSICLLLSCNSSNDDVDPIVEEMEEMEIEEEIDENNNSNPGLVRSIDDGFKITYEYDGDKLIMVSGEDSNRNLMVWYTYNDNDTIMLKGIYDHIQHQGTLDIQYTYEYDTDGRLIEFGHNQGEVALLSYQDDQVTINYENSSFQQTLELDQTGRVIRYDSDNFYRIYSYDSLGNVVLAEEYDQGTDELMNTYQYTYDTNNNPFFGQFQSLYLSSFLSTFAGNWQPFSDNLSNEFLHSANNRTSVRINNEQPSTTTYTYNSNNQFIEAETNDPSNGTIKNYTFIYY